MSAPTNTSAIGRIETIKGRIVRDRATLRELLNDVEDMEIAADEAIAALQDAADRLGGVA